MTTVRQCIVCKTYEYSDSQVFCALCGARLPAVSPLEETREEAEEAYQTWLELGGVESAYEIAYT